MRIVTSLFIGALFLQQQPPTESITVGNQLVVLSAPNSFVEVSKLFPDGFALRQETLPPSNRLLAWLIPVFAVKDRLNNVAPTYVTLQVQVLTSMIDGRYDSRTIEAMTEELRATSDQLPALATKAFQDLLRKPRFEELGVEIGFERPLGVLESGSDFVTMGTVVVAKAPRNQVSARLALSCFFLVRSKVVLLITSGRSPSSAELASNLELLREWRAAMRAANRQ